MVQYTSPQNKQRKRIICLLAVLSLLVCGCGAKRAYKANNNPVIETETETENTTEARTEAETEIEIWLPQSH